jgi:uncharacterized protein
MALPNMDIALVVSALLMGIAGAPHCTAMCGAACGALTRRCSRGASAGTMASFQLGRLLGYAAGGAIAASGVSSLALLSRHTPALRPLGMAVHLAALGLGLWLLCTGRQPAWLGELGRTPAPATRAPLAVAGGWQRLSGPLRAAAGGGLWLAWPCGLLQSALMLSALANGPLSGAAVMGAFALASSIGLWALPALWMHWIGRDAAGLAASTWPARLGGAALAGASAWALGHDLWQRIAAFCAGWSA